MSLKSYIKYKLQAYILKDKLRKLDKSKKILILQLASGLGDYLGARKQIYKHINKGLKEAYNIIVIGGDRWKDFATYYDKNVIDIFLYIKSPYSSGEKLSTNQSLIKILPKADVYIDIIGKVSENYIIPNYIKATEKYNIIQHGNLEKLKASKGYIYCDGYKRLFDNLQEKYTLKNIASKQDLWKFNNINKIYKKVSLLKTKGYIVIFSEGFTRGSLNNEQITIIINYFLNKTDCNIILCGILRERKEINKLIRNVSQNNKTIKSRIYNYYQKINTYDLPYVIQNANIVVTTDTAPYHIAIQMDKKVLCITNLDFISLKYGDNIYNLVDQCEKLSDISYDKIKQSLTNVMVENI